METLLSDAYNADHRGELVDPAGALDGTARPGKVDGYGGIVKLRRADSARLGASSGAGEPTVGHRVGRAGDGTLDVAGIVDGIVAPCRRCPDDDNLAGAMAPRRSASPAGTLFPLEHGQIGQLWRSAL